MTDSLASYFDAVTLSYLMHKGQLRRDLSIPYWTHVSLVSSTVAEWGGDFAQIIGALGHDLVEDTDMNITTIVDLLGVEPGAIIDGMTASKDSDIPWTDRKLTYIAGYLNETVDPRTYLVKLADMHSNMTSFSNTAVRLGKPSAKDKTINSYVVLAHICLEKLKKFGSATQFAVASYNINRMLDRIQDAGVCPTAVMLSYIGGEPTSSEDWYKRLESLWDLAG